MRHSFPFVCKKKEEERAHCQFSIGSFSDRAPWKWLADRLDVVRVRSTRRKASNRASNVECPTFECRDEKPHQIRERENAENMLLIIDHDQTVYLNGSSSVEQHSSKTVSCANLACDKSIHQLEKLIVHFTSHQLMIAVLVDGIQDIAQWNVEVGIGACGR